MGQVFSQYVNSPTWVIITTMVCTLLSIGYLGIFWGALVGIQRQNGVPNFSRSFATVMLWINIIIEILLIVAFFFMIWGLVIHLNHSSSKPKRKITRV